MALAAAVFAAALTPIAATPAFAKPSSPLEIFVAPGAGASGNASGNNGNNSSNGNNNVGNNGNNNAAEGRGTKKDPYTSLERARTQIRNLKAKNALPAGGVTITLRGGDYERASTFELQKQDSGTAESPITYRAYPGEQVRLTGGRVLDGDAFTPAGTTGAGARLSPEARTKIVQYDLGAAGITNLGGIVQTGYGLPPGDEAAEIFFNGAPMTVARYPNAGTFVKTGAVTNPGGNPRQVIGGNSTSRPLDPVYDIGATFKFADQRPETWASTEGAWMYGYWYWDWADGNLAIDSIDAATNSVTTKNASHYTVRPGQRYYYYNIPEELDAPGEYYLDRAANVLYFNPPAQLAGSTVDLSLLTEPVVNVNGASYVTFSGINIENSRGDGIKITSGDHNRVVDSTLANLGGWGARIEGGVDNSVTGSEITRIGHGGVYVGGGDRPTLTRADNSASGNKIHDFSRLALTYNPGIMLSGVGNTAADNEVFDAPHQGIAFEGNDHMIEYNDVHDVVQDTADSGAIYSVRDWSWTGTTIRYNYVHNIGGANAPGHDQEGIYLDDLTSGITVTGNVLVDIPLAFLIGGGRSNTIENNLVINSRSGMSLDARGTNWAAGHCAPNGGMQKSLEKMPYQNELWSGRYPWLTGLIADQPCIPKNNSVQRNVFLNSGAPSIDGQAVATGTVGNNWVTSADLRFANVAEGDLTLLPDSPVFTNVPGFEVLPFERMRKSTEPSFLPPEPLDIGLDGWSGLGNPSKEQVHSGTGSHAVVADREILTRTSTVQSEGTVSVWFYDDAADTNMMVAANASMGDTGDLFRALGVATPTSATNYVYRTGTAFVATAVPRTTGWHHFEWVYGAGGNLDMKIDGTTVTTNANSPSFDRIQLGDWWSDSRTGKVYFDDVSIG